MFLGTLLFIAAVKNPKLIFDMNEFTISNKRIDKTRWRCTSHNKNRCKAALFTYQKTVEVLHEHSHPPNRKALYPNSVSQCVTIIRRKKY